MSRDLMNANTLKLLKKYNALISEWNFPDDDTVELLDVNDNTLETISVDDFEKRFSPDCIGFEGELND